MSAVVGAVSPRLDGEVAIVVLNFNGRGFLEDCLASLRRLTAPAELVVADNASSDGSVAYLRERHPDVRVLAFEKNWGFAQGYNRALSEVKARWVALLNNDATLEPDWLERLLDAANRRPQAAILGGKLLFSGPTTAGRIIQSAGARFTDAGSAFEIGWGEPDRGQHDRPGAVSAIPGAAQLVKLDAFRILGGFDGDYYAYLEDVDLCWRAWLAGYEVWYEPAAVAYHRFGGSWGGRASPTRIYWMQRNRLANMIKHLEPASLPHAWAVSVAYDLYRLLEYSLRGQFSAVRALAGGTTAFLRAWPQLAVQRTRLQPARQMSDRELRERGLLVPALAAFREYRRLSQVKLAAL